MSDLSFLVCVLMAGAIAAAALATAHGVWSYRSRRVRWRLLLRPEWAPSMSRATATIAARWRRILMGIATGAAGRAASIQVVCGAVVVAGTLGLATAGPVASATLAVYAGLAARLALRARRRRAEERSHRAAVDAVAAVAAELRAGRPVAAALRDAAVALEGDAVVGEQAATVGRRLTAAVEVAASSGAPMADVLDRLDAHLRAAARAHAAAAAQSAGARTSTALLAGMPVFGVALGPLLGVNPLHTLLHTPLGAACLAAAVVLQLAGLAWAARLSQVRVVA